MRNKIYDMLWGKNTPLKKRLALFAVFAVFFFLCCTLWKFCTVKVEFALDLSKDAEVQLFYSRNLGMKEKNSKTWTQAFGNKMYSITLPMRKVNCIRIDTGGEPNVTVKLPEIKIFHGFAVRTISLANLKSFHPHPYMSTQQFYYHGDGIFITKGKDPFITFNFKKIPSQFLFPFASIVFCLFLTVILFFIPALLAFCRNFCRHTFLYGKRRICLLFSDYHFLFYAAAIILLGWGFEIFNFTFTFDDEAIFCATRNSLTGAWIEQDRWGMALMSWLTGNPTVPVIPLAVTLFCYFLSFCIIFYSPRSADKYFLFPVYAVFPMLFQSFSFSSLNPNIGILFLLAALSAHFFHKHSKKAFLWAILCAVFVAGSYTIFILYIAAAVLYIWLSRAIKHRFYQSAEYLRYIIGKFLILIVGTYVLYKISLWISASLFPRTECNFVSDNYIHPIKDIPLWVRCVLAKISAAYRGTVSYFPKKIFFQDLSILLCFLSSIALIISGKIKLFSKILFCFAFIFLLSCPFFPDLLHQHAWIPLRVLTIMLPLALVSFFQATLLLCRNHKNLRNLICLLLLILSAQYLWILNQCVYLNYMQNKRDQMLVGEIQNRMKSSPEIAFAAAQQESIPVLIIGSLDTPPSKPYPFAHIESIGLSCIKSPERLVCMLTVYEGPRYSYSAPASASPAILAYIENMPMWPSKGSIAYYDGYLIVKFSDPLPGTLKLRGQRQVLRNQLRINGFEELFNTLPDPKNLLYSYDLQSLKVPNGELKKNGFCYNVSDKGGLLLFPAKKFDCPYVILEITVDYDQNDSLTLWGNQSKKSMLFSFTTGETCLRVRCPAYFLDKTLRIDLGSGNARRILLKSIKVYEDKKYTENFLLQNPEVTKKKLQEALHD